MSDLWIGQILGLGHTYFNKTFCVGNLKLTSFTMNLPIRNSGVLKAHFFVLISHSDHLFLVPAGLEHLVSLFKHIIALLSEEIIAIFFRAYFNFLRS